MSRKHSKAYRLIFIILTYLFIAKTQAQTEYIIINDPQHPEVKILQGKISKYLVKRDSSYAAWYKSSQQIYIPDTAVLKTFRRKGKQFQYIIFGGTWCDDTQFILPKFFKLQEMSSIPDKNISFFGVDRNKKALGRITDTFAIINVPTIIVMKNEKEIGRIVEYGKTGKWDKELADIIDSF